MRHCNTLAFGALSLIAVCSGASAQTALALKTWVSSTGTNTGTCDVTAPCATFAYAYSQTSAGGEIEVVNPGRYGTLTINHAISIISQGSAATIGLAANGVGITVAAGSSDVVNIRGITIDGFNTSQTTGILVKSANRVIIDGCILERLNFGIYFDTTTANGILTNNAISSGTNGIYISQAPYVAISGNKIAANLYGLQGNNSRVYSYNDNVINSNFTNSSGITFQSIDKQ